MPQLSAVEGCTNGCKFILGNCVFALNILSTMCWWRMPRVDLKTVPVAWEPKAWLITHSAGDIEQMLSSSCASTCSAVPAGTLLPQHCNSKDDSMFGRGLTILMQYEYQTRTGIPTEIKKASLGPLKVSMSASQGRFASPTLMPSPIKVQDVLHNISQHSNYFLYTVVYSWYLEITRIPGLKKIKCKGRMAEKLTRNKSKGSQAQKSESRQEQCRGQSNELFLMLSPTLYSRLKFSLLCYSNGFLTSAT